MNLFCTWIFLSRKVQIASDSTPAHCTVKDLQLVLKKITGLDPLSMFKTIEAHSNITYVLLWNVSCAIPKSYQI